MKTPTESRNRRRWQKVLALSVLGTLASVTAHAAWQIDPSELPEVRRLAHQIREDSRLASFEADRYANYNDPYERRVTDDLREFTRDAFEFDREVENRYLDPVTVDQDFRRMNQDYRRVEPDLVRLRAYPVQRALFARLDRSVRELRRLRRDDNAGPGYDRIQPIAHALTESARDLLNRARSETRYNEPWKETATREVESLVFEADRLYQMLQTYRDDYQTRGQFQQVRMVHERVRSSVLGARFSVFVVQALDHVSRVVSDLDRAYAGEYLPPAPPAPPVYVPGPGPRPRPPVVVVPGGGPQHPRPPVVVPGPGPAPRPPVVVVPGGGPQGPRP